jgi:hypothetical protein
MQPEILRSAQVSERVELINYAAVGGASRRHDESRTAAATAVVRNGGRHSLWREAKTLIAL